MSGAASFGMLLIRVMVGVVMVAHGSQKLFGAFGGPGIENFAKMVGSLGLPGNIPPLYLAYASAIVEFGGGILLILGFLTRIAAICIAVNFAVAVWKVHWPNGFFLSPADGVGYEYALTLGVIAVGIIFTGAGLISIDGAIWGRSGKEKESKKKD